MPYVKLDTCILDSSLWPDRDARDVFITALLMAEPRELDAPTPQLKVGSLDEDGFVVPPGSYGFVPAAGPGIVRRAGVDLAAGMAALHRLGSEEFESRSKEFGGRRLVRVDGGYVVLNFAKYREKDHTAADRMRRYRERLKAEAVTRNGRNEETDSDAVTRNVTDAEAEASAEEIQNTHTSGACTGSNGHAKPADASPVPKPTETAQEALKRPTAEAPRPPAVQPPKGPPRAAEASATGTMSRDADQVLAAIREHDAFAEVADRVADKLWGQAMSKKPLPWVLAAVRACGEQADLAAAAGHPWALAYCLDRLGRYVANAKAPVAEAPTKPPFRRPEDIKQGRWSMTDENRRLAEERNKKALPALTEADIDELTADMPPDEAATLRAVMRQAS